MLILEYISMHGTPSEWCAARLSARESKGHYRRMSNHVGLHHAQACVHCVDSTRGERDPLQLAEHSGDAAGVLPAIADIPGCAMLHDF